MKTKKYFFALAMIGVLAFASCTPNSISDDEAQQVKTLKIRKPSQG